MRKVALGSAAKKVLMMLVAGVTQGCALKGDLTFLIYSIAPEPVSLVSVTDASPPPGVGPDLAGAAFLQPHVTRTFSRYDERPIPESIDVEWTYETPNGRAAVLRLRGRVPGEVLQGGGIVVLLDGETASLGWLLRCDGGVPVLRTGNCVQGGALAEAPYNNALSDYDPALPDPKTSATLPREPR